MDRSRTSLEYEHVDDREVRVRSTPSASAPGGLLVSDPRENIRMYDDIELANQLTFDETGRNSLSSRVHYHDQTGTYEQTRLSINESLRLTHGMGFRGDYGLNWQQNEYSQTRSDILHAHASLTHQLYESLESNVELHGIREDTDARTRDIQGGSVSFNYRKRIPYGRLFINLGAGTEATNEGGSAGTQQVIDESRELATGTVTFLANVNVMVETIVVTNADGSRTYLLNVDYRVVARGIRTELQRIPTGLIADGETVLVDYAYNISTLLDYTATTSRARVQVDLFEHVSVYASMASLTHGASSEGNASARLEDVYDTLYGVELQWGGARLMAEHEIRDSTLTPSVSDRVNFSVTRTLRRIHSITTNASWQHTTFGTVDETPSPTTSDETTTHTASLTYRVTPPRLPSLSVELGYQQTDDRSQSETYTFTRIEFEYRVRAVDISAGMWLRQRDGDFTDETANYYFFNVKRKF